MTAGRHNLTRRSLLGAAFGASALGASGDAAGGFSASPWAHALAEFRRAEGLLAVLDPAAPEELFGELASTRLGALRRLLLAPAPDLAALSMKIDLTVDEEVATLIDAEPCLAELKADGRRLMRETEGRRNVW